MKIKTILIAFSLILFISGCSSQLKAPCNEHATFCGMKTKINQW